MNKLITIVVSAFFFFPMYSYASGGDDPVEGIDIIIKEAGLSGKVVVNDGHLKRISALKDEARSIYLSKILPPLINRTMKGSFNEKDLQSNLRKQLLANRCNPCKVFETFSYKGINSRTKKPYSLQFNLHTDLKGDKKVQGRGGQVNHAWVSEADKKIKNLTNINSQALRAHNQIRAQVRQRPLKISKDLQSVSQAWAAQLAKSCKMYHHKEKDFPAGENLFYSSTPTSINNAIQAWAAEKKNYNYKQNTCPKGKQCYHYTQMVWKGTQEVGCAIQRCANNSGAEIHVCTYFPRGNIVGARPY